MNIKIMGPSGVTTISDSSSTNKKAEVDFRKNTKQAQLKQDFRSTLKQEKNK